MTHLIPVGLLRVRLHEQHGEAFLRIEAESRQPNLRAVGRQREAGEGSLRGQIENLHLLVARIGDIQMLPIERQ